MDNNTITAAARTWIGTSFKHQGRLKKTEHHSGGVDCIGLIVGVSRELGICDAQGVPLHLYDRVNYGRRPIYQRLEFRLGEYLQPIEAPEYGAIALFNLRHHGRHVGLLAHHDTKGDTLIHAHTQAGKVEETRLDPFWRTSAQAYFVFPERKGAPWE